LSSGVLEANEVVFCSFLERWLPRAMWLRAAHPGTRCVWFLESDADFEGLTCKALTRAANFAPADKTIVRLGYNVKFFGSGAQCVLFRGDSLKHVKQHMFTKRPQHFDLFLKKNVGRLEWYSPHSLVGWTGHKSIIFGSGKAVTRPGRKACCP
jgi:hypothetical protein